MGKIKENWQLAVFITVLSVILSGFGAVVSNRIADRDNKVNTSATTEYVDKKHLDMKGYIDTQDDEIKRRVATNEGYIHAIEGKMEGKADKTDIHRIDQKLDKIYELLISR